MVTNDKIKFKSCSLTHFTNAVRKRKKAPIVLNIEAIAAKGMFGVLDEGSHLTALRHCMKSCQMDVTSLSFFFQAGKLQAALPKQMLHFSTTSTKSSTANG
mmetsp:Transcript_16437/g.24667  ORF Transcript_16437/g.24667 Transcript_16437/m.24667 type:complete len:101 (+) Transcript_16437:202-504(+)